MVTELRIDLPGDAKTFFDAALTRCSSEGGKALLELFPQLPRRIGRVEVNGSSAQRIEFAFGEKLPARCNLAAWRQCDLAALLLARAAKADGSVLLDLYRHGDMDERIEALRVASLSKIDAGIVALLEEAHRSNMESHFSAATCDSNLPARAAGVEAFGIAGFNRIVLKCAFIGLPLSRLLDANSLANVELSRMLLDLASEREAAGRPVWPDMLEFVALAPCPGTIARVIGGLEHGDDKIRRGAARALLTLGHADLVRFAKERVDREPRTEIQDLLRQALRAASR